MRSYQVDRATWGRLSIFQQMGNIGSEVGRTFAAIRSGNDERTQAAFERALDLFDATAEILAAEKSPRTAEVLRAREQFAASVMERQSDSTLEKYFMQFAVAVRLRQFA